MEGLLSGEYKRTLTSFPCHNLIRPKEPATNMSLGHNSPPTSPLTSSPPFLSPHPLPLQAVVELAATSPSIQGAETPKKVAEQCSTVITMLPNDLILKSVCLEGVSGFRVL